MCFPHPIHVGLPQLLQVVLMHMVCRTCVCASRWWLQKDSEKRHGKGLRATRPRHRLNLSLFQQDDQSTTRGFETKDWAPQGRHDLEIPLLMGSRDAPSWMVVW